MSGIMREEVIYKYSIEDVRGMSIMELYGLIFADIASNDDPDFSQQLWLDRVVCMFRNKYVLHCFPDKKSSCLDGNNITITVNPCGEEGLEIKYRHKELDQIYCSYWTTDECFDFFDWEIAGATDGKNTTV